MGDFYERLRGAVGRESVKRQEPMRNHTTFRIGGPARYFVEPGTAEDLAAAIGLCREEKMPFYIIGNGSNLLVDDEGYDGVILCTERLNRCRVEGDEVTAQAGILLSRMARAAAEAELTGFEFAAGIPGTLGGAAVMNAGAYGSELKDVLVWARILDRDGQVRTLDAQKLQLGYRSSCIGAEGYVVLEACVKLCRGDRKAIEGRMEELAARRREKQPLEYPSAGSTFKRPEGHFAGKLIMDAGFAGYSVGGAKVSEKHCGFVINTGDATARDVRRLISEIQEQVKERFRVDLEPEIVFLG